MTDSADEADLLILVHWGRGIPGLVRRFPEKCFLIDDSDDIFPLLHGVFASGHKKMWFRGRVRTGCFHLYQTWLKNPFVEGHSGDSWQKPKKYLASFQGRTSHPCRKRLLAAKFRRQDILVRCGNRYDRIRNVEDRRPDQKDFAEVLQASRFALCPRGSGASTIRLFEAMQMGVSPVIQSDDWILPNGPEWKTFAIFLSESEPVEAAVEAAEPRYREMGRLARQAWEQYFSPETYFDFLVHEMVEVRRRQVVPEVFFWKTRHVRKALWLGRRFFQRQMGTFRRIAARIDRMCRRHHS